MHLQMLLTRIQLLVNRKTAVLSPQRYYCNERAMNFGIIEILLKYQLLQFPRFSINQTQLETPYTVVARRITDSGGHAVERNKKATSLADPLLHSHRDPSTSCHYCK